METNKHICPNRCELAFDYDWQHTNLNEALIKGDIKYFLNGGDEISIEVDKITPNSVYVLFNGNVQELTNGDNVWSGTIPSEWNSQGVFSVIADYNGCKVLLYQGLLNQDTNKTTDLDYVIYSSDSTINVSLTSDGAYDLSLNQYTYQDTINLIQGSATLEDSGLLNAVSNNIQTIIFTNLDGATLYFRLSKIKDGLQTYACYDGNYLYDLSATNDGKIEISNGE